MGVIPATPADYRRQIDTLLPEGAAWRSSGDGAGVRDHLLDAAAVEYARIHNRLLDLIEESDPRTTGEMLTDWEQAAGLPDDCTGLADTLQERRNQLVAKITQRGGQSRQFFIDVAAALGFTVTITEFSPFQVGSSSVGDPLAGEDWWFAWQINAPEETVREFRTGQSTAGEPLRDWGNDLLECVISRLKPAHTDVKYTYGG
jgi:uncharacterized protein YmfQ (DUF2313 family)